MHGEAGVGMTGTQLRDAAREFREGSALARAQGEALRRQHLVWWEGAAAEEYSRRIRARVRGLEELADCFEEVAGLFESVGLLVDRAGSPTGLDVPRGP